MFSANTTVPGFGEIAEKLRRSTVHVQAPGGRGSGSGIIWDSSGIVVTNAHVVGNSRQLRVELWDKRAYEASIRSIDYGQDLASLQIKGAGLPAAEIADSEGLRVGELVIAVGNPLGFTGALTTGVVHAIAPMNGGRRRWIQASVRLAPGNSGGPLADARGRVIGINTMVSGPLGLAIPSSTAARFVLRKGGAPALGVTVRPVTVRVEKGRALGLMILEIAQDGPASAASMLPGDIITGVGGERLASVEDLTDALEASEQGVLKLRFLRGGQGPGREVVVRLGAKRAEAA
jgi:serine protease Do